MMTLERRIDEAERRIGEITPDAEPRFEFFAVNFPSLDYGTEFYYWLPEDVRYAGNYRAAFLDELQAEGAEVVLLFDPADFDFVFRPDWTRVPHWAFPDYRQEHFIAWRDYTPGDCLARARAARHERMTT